MSKVKVPLWQAPQKCASIDTEATKGATIGTNLYWPGGAVVTEAELRQAAAAPAPSVSRTMWSLVLSIPPNVTALQNATGTGLFAVTGAGTGALRAITGTAGEIDVANGDAVAGPPTLSLADTAVTPGAYVLPNVTFDAKGRATAAASNDAPSDGTTYGRKDGAWSAITGGGGGGGDPRLEVIDPIFDFMGRMPTSATAAAGASYGWMSARLDGTITSVDGGATAPGVVSLNQTPTGTTSIQYGSGANITLGGAEIVIPFRFRVSALSDGTNAYTLNIGPHDNFTTATNDRIAVRYTHTENGGKLVLRATAATVNTDANGTTTVVANTFISGRIVINAAGTQADLYVGGSATPEATITTGLPTAGMMLGAFFSKTAGSAARSLQMDYLGPPQFSFTSPR